jgi:DNA-directed RNA polymerase specialized sigma24 family protein
MTGIVEPELERFTRGDIQAFEALFREYQGEVYGWIIRIVHDPSAAEDLTIETFLADLSGPRTVRSLQVIRCVGS